MYYLFEKFTEIIELPPQPVALDLSLWLENYDAFELLEEADNHLVPVENILDDNLQRLPAAMFERVLAEEQTFVGLTPMGYLFHERCRLQFAKQETTLLERVPQTPLKPEQKKIDLRGDHGDDILMAFAKKIRKSPYVVEIVNSLPYNSKATKQIRRTTRDGLVEFVLIWTDRGLGMCIKTTGRNRAETNTIAAHLATHYTE